MGACSQTVSNHPPGSDRIVAGLLLMGRVLDMPGEISLPRLSDTMEEGTLLEWHVRVGDRVCRGDVIADVETDKATMELEIDQPGVVHELRVAPGETVPVGTVIALVEPGEEATMPGNTAESGGQTGAISPAARQRAVELGLDPARMTGSGPGGRIVLEDVEQVAGFSSTPTEAEKTAIDEGLRKQQKSVKIRRIMARKMTEGWQTIPHFYVTYTVDMTDVIRFRKDLGTTINAFVLAAVARTLDEHPWVNSWWVDGEAVEQPRVNVAMAVATDRGLYNPVLKDCARLSLKEISRRAEELSARAHGNRLLPEDLEGGTFTVSNMGMLGVESFRAIITPPQAAVLAVGTVRGEVVVDDHGEPAVAPVARMTLAGDHRILDGADAAEFMMTLKSYLEAPVTLVSCDYGKDGC